MGHPGDVAEFQVGSLASIFGKAFPQQILVAGQHPVVNILSSNQEIEETRCLGCSKADSTWRKRGQLHRLHSQES